MSKDVLLSFSLCANGDFLLNVAEGHNLVVEEAGHNQLRISTSPSIISKPKAGRKSEFAGIARIGTVMDDGSIYAGVSPSTKRPFFIPSKEHMKSLIWSKMMSYILSGKFHGHDDWQLASEAEYHHLFEARYEENLVPIIRTRTYSVAKKDGNPSYVHTYGKDDVGLHTSRYFIPIRYGALAPKK